MSEIISKREGQRRAEHTDVSGVKRLFFAGGPLFEALSTPSSLILAFSEVTSE